MAGKPVSSIIAMGTDTREGQVIPGHVRSTGCLAPAERLLHVGISRSIVLLHGADEPRRDSFAHSSKTTLECACPFGRFFVTTPYALWHYAVQYYRDGRYIVEGHLRNESEQVHDGLVASLPAYLVVCKGIELVLKAYLRAKRVTAGDLKKEPFGHDLEALLGKAEALGLDEHVTLSDRFRGALEIINREYKTKALEYAMIGQSMDLPDISVLGNGLGDLIRGTGVVCSRASKNKTFLNMYRPSSKRTKRRG